MTGPAPAPAAPAGLYVHVPFCRALCTYCAFAKEEYARDRAEAWLDGLAAECAYRAGATWGRPAVDTVFLGGGTPSALTESQWRRLGELVQDRFQVEAGAEWTAEANPESFLRDRAEAMRAAGVNRVSLGVQTLDPDLLRRLGRIHGPAEVERAVRNAREVGFPSVSLDLMYGLPGQTVATFAATLDAVLALAPDHLSAYCLGLEPGTPLAEAVTAGREPTPDDEIARAQYELLLERTEAAGLSAYEISNFARPGHACRHNRKYWLREDFLPLGPSAHGLVRGLRWANPAPLDRWLAAYARGGRPPDPRPVPEPEARFEWVFLRLRLAEGLDTTEYARTWGRSFADDHGAAVARLRRRGLLECEGTRVRLPRTAWFLSDGVFVEFAPEPETS